MRSTTRSVCGAVVVCFVAGAMVLAQDRGGLKKDVRQGDRFGTDSGIELVTEPDSNHFTPADQVTPLRPGARFRPYVINTGPVQASTAVVASTSVYVNDFGTNIFSPGNGLRIADDVTTVGVNGCKLDKFSFRVAGDAKDDPNVLQGSFTVDFALFKSCPSANSFPQPIALTSGTANLGPLCSGGSNDGNPCTVQSDCPGGICDDAFHEIFMVIPQVCSRGTNSGLPCTTDSDCPGGTFNNPAVCGVTLPRSFFLAVTFSGTNTNAGIVFGGLPRLGFSSNTYDNPNDKCGAAFGVFPSAPHASFDVQVFTRGNCRDSQGGRSFVGYKNSKHSNLSFSPGNGKLFADDIRLPVKQCNMVAYEVAMRGPSFGLASGIVTVQFHEFLDAADPENGGLIPGTRRQFQVSSGPNVQVGRAEFDPPIPLPEGGNPLLNPFFVKFETSSKNHAPVAVCRQSDLGTTEDGYFVWNGTRPPSQPPGPNDNWGAADIPDCFSAFDITIYCEGDPPSGACCDVIFTDDNVCSGGPNNGAPCLNNDMCECPVGDPTCIPGECVGDSVCRELPQMNCAFPALWAEGGRCGPICNNGPNAGLACDCPSACVGGTKDGLSCLSDSNCPGGSCNRGACNGSTQKCVGGPRNGLACCPSSCVGGSNDGLSCSVAGDCPGGTCEGVCGGQFCVGGINDGLACTSNFNCVPGGVCGGSFCAGGPKDGLSCTRQADCSPLCVGGVNNLKPCLRDADCPNGTCDGTGTCTQQPFLNDQACGTSACCFIIPQGQVNAGLTDCNNDTEKECFAEGDSVDDPRLFQRGEKCNASGQACPITACLRKSGECTIAQPAVCVGGTEDGLPCIPDDPFDPCLLSPGATCPGTPGCGDPFCCTAVCCAGDPNCAAPPLANAQCCTMHWGQFCADDAFQEPDCSQRLPANDECFDPDPDKGAQLIPFLEPGIPSDNIGATENPTDPGFCCDNINPGAQGVGTTWFKFIATDTQVNIQTCLTEVGGDSLIQVFSVADPNRGICDNMAPCDLSVPFCGDGSTCRFDEQFACENLRPIACNDDAGQTCCSPSCQTAGDDRLFRSRLCAQDLVVGAPYYIMLASKAETVCRGGPNDRLPCNVDSQCTPGVCRAPDPTKFKLTLTPFCNPSAPLPLISNDLCQNATVLNDIVPDPSSLVIDFDLSGAPTNKCIGGANHGQTCVILNDCPGGICDNTNHAPVTFDCPGSNFCPILENDVWYEWNAPATGLAIFQTGPEETLAVYEGCNCPIDPLSEIQCDQSGIGNSTVNIFVFKDVCYMIRVGGRNGSTPAGQLLVQLNACTDMPVTFVDPPNGTVDARQDHPPLLPSARQGIDQFVVTSGGNVQNPTMCWDLCESGTGGLFGNSISTITNTFCVGGSNDTQSCLNAGDCPGGTCSSMAGQFTVRLARPITVGEVTTLTYKHGGGGFSVGAFTFHPGNVDAGPVADATDYNALMAMLINPATPALDRKYRGDTDRSDLMAPADLLRLIDLLSGDAGFNTWLNTPKPLCGICSVCSGGTSPGQFCSSDFDCGPGGTCVCP